MVIYQWEEKYPTSVQPKKKIIIRSFTETVIVAVGYCIPDVLWPRYLLCDQGNDIFWYHFLSRQ